MEAPAVFTVKSELHELKETVTSSLCIVTRAVYSSVENNEKRLEMVIIVKYLLTSLLLFFFFFFFLLLKALPPHPIPAQDQISTHSGEAHNRVENRANHMLLCLCFTKA